MIIMEDRFIKYSKLYAIIFLMFLAVPVLLGLIVAAFYGVSKLVSSSYVDIIFGLGVITMGPALFSSVYVIFFKRTKQHPVAAVRIISQILFIAGIAISVFVLISDMISFFTKFNIDIGGYRCFNLAYMAGNVGGLFLVAIIQAFTTEKEVDWMERKR
jgi:hypothetical protein